MTDPEAETLAYYDRHAAAFAAQTAGLDLSPLYDRFLGHVPPGGRLLDAGCGVGRDSLAFVRRGYAVEAFDASAAMVAAARDHLRGLVTVHRRTFEAIAWQAAFDGVWCCASLLHVPQKDFLGVAARLLTALRLGGVWYLSFKHGEGEHWRQGRLFVDHTEATLRAALSPLPLELLDLWVSADHRPGRADERWLNAVVRRPGNGARLPSDIFIPPAPRDDDAAGCHG